MFRSLLIPFLYLAVSCLLTSCSGIRGSQLDALMETEMRAGKIPGAAVAILKNGELLEAKAYGIANLELGVPVTTRSVFELASVTKPITAAAILMLVDDGRVALDDHVSKYLDETPEAWKDITIRQLLCHQGGLAHHFEEKVNGSHLVDYSKADMLRSARKTPVDSKPGTGWEYSDLGYFLLGVVIEKSTGQSYEQFMTKRVFAPLGMRSTSIINQAALLPNRVAGHTVVNGELQHNRRVWQFDLTSHMGIMSSLEDLIRCERAMAKRQMFTETIMNRMWSPAYIFYEDKKAGAMLGYGFGWFVERQKGHSIVHHSGFTGTHYLRDLGTGLTVILLTNRDYSAGTTTAVVARKIARLFDPSFPDDPMDKD
ncbi:MAG: beta-lactamase family protein [Akkermansiaceae bacterium]|nr:beta-lactamase family protein [Verrucomicrobiales bacterium]